MVSREPNLPARLNIDIVKRIRALPKSASDFCFFEGGEAHASVPV